ncbi:MAG: hypothetical protein V1778_00055 [bacterium]
MSIAHFSGILGRGVVYAAQETYVIEVGKMYQPERAGTTNLNMWMQGPGDIQEMEPGEYPFIAVYDRMKEAAEEAAAELREITNRTGGKP